MMRAVVLLILVAVAAPAAAQRVSKVDGNKLMSLCRSSDIKGCDGYVAGVADALAEVREDAHVACIPARVTNEQLRDVVLKYLHDEPQYRQLPGGHLAVHAFAKAWPCKK
jgi:hypothetical protein